MHLKLKRKHCYCKAKKGKRNEKSDRLEKINYWIEKHRFHQNRLEAILRMIDNGNLKPEQVEMIKDDIKYYIEENQEGDFEENEFIYEDLKLEEAEIYGIGKEDSEDEKSPQEVISVLQGQGQTGQKKKKEEKISKKGFDSIPAKVVSTTLDSIPPKVVPTTLDSIPLAPILRYSVAAMSAPKSEIVDIHDGLNLKGMQEGRGEEEEKEEDLWDQNVLNDKLLSKLPPSLDDLILSHKQTVEKAKNFDGSFCIQMVDLSFLNLPDAQDSSKLRSYFPSSPYPVPGYYPQTPLSVFSTNPVIFERFDVDTLFFIFYFRPGTNQQYLAAKELKRQSWRFHSKYQTWFQRHEEPQEVNENYEQGCYLYFDYEKSWCQRKKFNFKFEYK